MGVQGKDFKADLLGPNSKPSKGLRKANLSPRTKALLEEVALSEQVLSFLPCIHPPSLKALLTPRHLPATKLHQQPLVMKLHSFVKGYLPTCDKLRRNVQHRARRRSGLYSVQALLSSVNPTLCVMCQTATTGACTYIMTAS